MMSNHRNTKSPSLSVWATQMEKGIHTPHRVCKLTCTVSHILTPKLIDYLAHLGIHTVFIESGRVVRELRRSKRFGLSGTSISLSNSPVDIFRFTIPRECSQFVMESIINHLELHLPGRGSIFTQELIEFSIDDPPIIQKPLDSKRDEAVSQHWLTPVLHELTQVNCVLSTPGTADSIARLALELGIGVPVVSKGTGTDFRDKLGLIRIAIPADKEIVQLIMPDHDFNSIFRLLIEEAGLNRPGRGFIYRTPVSKGLLDTRLRIGKLKYAASMEQIIAAIDQLKEGTNWRKRVSCIDTQGRENRLVVPHDHCEISVICLEDRIEQIIHAAINAGATGATTTRVKRIIAKEGEKLSAARALSTISLPARITGKVMDALLDASMAGDRSSDFIQVLDSPNAYVPEW